MKSKPLHPACTQQNCTDPSATVAAPAPISLNPQDWDAFREQAHRMLDDMLGYTERIRERPVWQPIPEEVRARFQEPLPLQPVPLATLHDEFMHQILPFTAANTHPGFLGWVQGGGTPVGMLAEMLAAGLNANLGGRDQVPLEVERQVVEWMRALFDFPSGASGTFVTGTSMANFLAVVTARDARLGPAVRQEGVGQQMPRLTAYASTAVHGSIGRALDFAGLGSGSLRRVAVDCRHRIDLEALTAAIAADRARGLTPFLVVGNAGTVDTGAIDDLAGLGRLCAEQQLWFHVDGAFGALAMLAPRLKSRLQGIEQADSLAFDFHKWAQVPYDAGFLLVRDGTLQQQAFHSSCAYLQREQRGMSAGSPWPCDLGLDLSRSFRALKTWATLKAYGADAIGEVISHTCALAQYLERRILASDELELTAPVELNIVCFRYRFATEDTPSATELQNQLNRQLVIAVQEAGAVAPSTTVLDGRVAIRAAIVNHRTSHFEIDTLVEAVLSAGQALRPGTSADKKWQPWVEREARLRLLDAELAAWADWPPDLLPDRNVEHEVALRFERAGLLTQMGRPLDARSDHLRILELAPGHRQNLIDLGLLLVASGQRKAAQIVLAEAVRQYPDDIVCRVNLGATLLEGDDPAAAREQYVAALRLDPESPQAHGGMYYALTRLGDPEAAALHHQKSFGKRNVFSRPFRGDAQPVSVLLLVSSTGGNTPLEKLLDDRIFETHVVVADAYDQRVPLPDHQLVINGIGDVDVSGHALLAAESLLARTPAPVLNLPAAVRATSRVHNARRLKTIPGLVTPATAILPRSLLASPGGATALLDHGFRFPLLLRKPGFHMGQHFVRVESPASLAETLAQMPDATELLAIEYLDARGDDGCARKYRVMMVDGQLYPLHLAISQHWKIHYFSADMADRPEHRAEEAGFLADMHAVLGVNAMAALDAIQSALGLDYAGVDFGLNQRGEVLLFEANATMVVEQPGPGEHWNYRRAAVDRIHAAVRAMLLRSAGAPDRGAPSAQDTPVTAEKLSAHSSDRRNTGMGA